MSNHRPKDFFAKQIRSSHLIASGGITNPNSSDWGESFENLRLMIYPKDALETTTPAGISYIDGAFEGIVPPRLLDDSDPSDASVGTGLKVGEDVWLFISGAQNTHSTDHDADGVIDLDEKEKRANSGVVLFGGDVVVSGTLYAERQVVEVDLRQEGELFVSGNFKVQDYNRDPNFIQFMAPSQMSTLYSLSRDENSLSFVDFAGVELAIDAGSFKDAGGVVWNLISYGEIISTAINLGPSTASKPKLMPVEISGAAPFTLSQLNNTIEDYRKDLLIAAQAAFGGPAPLAGGAITQFRTNVSAVVTTWNVLDYMSTSNWGSYTDALDLLDAALLALAGYDLEEPTTHAEAREKLISCQGNIAGALLELFWLIIDTEIAVTANDGVETADGTTLVQVGALSSLVTAFETNSWIIPLLTTTDVYDAAPAEPASLYITSKDVIANLMAYSAYNPLATGDTDSWSHGPGSPVIFNVDSLNRRVGVQNDEPQASLDLWGTTIEDPKSPVYHPDHRIHDDAGVLQDVVLYIEGAGAQTPGESIFWHLTNKEEPLTWSHAYAIQAPEVFRVIGLKEDITNYDTNDIEPKVLTITDDGYVRFKEGGLGGAQLKEDRDGREDVNTDNKNESAKDANDGDIFGDDHDGGGGVVNGNPYDNGYYIDRWHGDTQVGHALDDVNQALKIIDDNKAWQWPDTDANPGGDKVTLRDDLNNVGIGTQNPVQKLHVYSGDGLNTAVRLQSNHTDGAGNVLNPAANVKIELTLDETVHGTISQNVRVGEDLTALGTDMVLQNHTRSGGIYTSTLHDDSAGNQVALAPVVIDSNGSALGTELQVLILSGTTGEDPVLDPRTFADTNFFVSGSIGSCVDGPGPGTDAGNGERGTAVFGGDVYVSGTVYSDGVAVGAGGGWRTAMNGVCMDVFTESAYGDEGTTPASDDQLLESSVFEFDGNGNPLTPNTENDDFSHTYFGFYSTENGLGGNGIVVEITLSPSTSSVDPTVIWDEVDPNNRNLQIVLPIAWDQAGNDDGSGSNVGDNIRITFQRILDMVNGGGVENYPAPTWPVRARIYNTWQSSNVAPGDITTLLASHTGQVIAYTLNGGGDSMRYVSWGADATSGNSPSEGMAEGTGDTFTRQDWAQGLLIPFDCAIVGYSVRYMSKDPFVITAPDIAPNGTERVEWEIGKLNEGTDPDPGTSYAGVATTAKIFTAFVDAGPIPWIAWHAADNATYPMKWVGEGDDGDAGHVDTLNIPVAAGETITVRALEKNCDIYSDYRAEASVTIWLQGGNVAGGAGAGAGAGMGESSIRSVTTLGPADGTGPVNNGATPPEPEYVIQLPTASMMNYIAATYTLGDHLRFDLPVAASNEGRTYIIKDSIGEVSDEGTNIRIAPTGADTLDQYTEWGGQVGPLKLEQNFASITIWSDGTRWLIS
jgi:hypothetical protein